MPRKLFDIDVEEITLCGSAANRKKFFIRKMEDSMKEFIEELKKFMAEDDEDIEGALEKEDIEKAEKVPDAAMKAIKGALNILNKYKADMPDDVLKAIKTLAKYASYGYGYPAKKADEKGVTEKTDDQLLTEAVETVVKATEVEDVEKAKKVVEQLSKATIKQLKKIVEICQKIIGKEEEKVKKTEELSPEIARDLEELATLKKFKEDTLKEKEETRKQEIEGLKKEKEDLKKEVEELKKSKGEKKGIEGHTGDGGAGDEDKSDKWPSLGPC